MNEHKLAGCKLLEKRLENGEPEECGECRLIRTRGAQPTHRRSNSFDVTRASSCVSTAALRTASSRSKLSGRNEARITLSTVDAT